MLFFDITSPEINNIFIFMVYMVTCGMFQMNSWYLWSGQVTNFTEEYLRWHCFGNVSIIENNTIIVTHNH